MFLLESWFRDALHAHVRVCLSCVLRAFLKGEVLA